MGQHIYCSAAIPGMWWERLWWLFHPLCLTQQYHLASIASQLSSTGISHHSLLPHIPSVHLSAANYSPHPGIAPQSLNFPFQDTRIPAQCMYGCGKDWFSFHLGCHRSAISLSALNISPLTHTIARLWGSDPFFSSPTHGGQVQSYWQSCSPPNSFVLPSFAWFYIFFSTGQVLLSALSWCSACTSVFESVFLMYLWREMYSMSAYSSSMLFS